MTRLRIRRSKPLSGAARVPGDKSVAHRALIFAALANGTSHLRNMPRGADVMSTARVLSEMGVSITVDGDLFVVEGVGLRGLRMPNGALDCGNSGTTMRLIAGLLSAQHFGTRLTGDASLSRRPMKRIIDPLRARGANIAGTLRLESQELYPPLSVAPLLPSEALVGLEIDLPIPSAQVKTALLLSGLYADGITAIAEPMLSRDHTERMLVALGAPLERIGSMLMLDPTEWSRSWSGFDWTMPGDLSSAAFLVAAGLVTGSNDLTVEDVGLNPTRSGFLDALRPMGANVHAWPGREACADEPCGAVRIGEQRRLTSGRAGGELTLRMIDDIPAFAAICARATGTSEIRDADELRVKESDRIDATIETLRKFGVSCDELEDGMKIRGSETLRAATVDSRGDHRIAMMATCLGLAANGESIVEGAECIDVSFPGFVATLQSLGADIRTEDA